VALSSGSSVTSPTGAISFVPLDHDLERAVRWGREAATAVANDWRPAQDPEPVARHVEELLRSGLGEGRLVTRAGTLLGLVLWDRPSRLRLVLGTVILAEAHRSVAEYRAVLEAVGEFGRLHLVPSPLVGLAPEEESGLLTSLRFARFGRTEMRRPVGEAGPDQAPPAGVTLRPARADDAPRFATVLAAAFERHFDRYLFQFDEDYAADTARSVAEILAGQYGEYLAWASGVAERDGAAVGALLMVRAPPGPMIINVAVDPLEQGRGVGRALVLASLRALRDRKETLVLLNVTDGNVRASRLYADLGFSPYLTGWSWYSLDTVAVSPEGQPTSPPTTPDGSP
jgi:ribosomal protein S18 acetylase RimI-like enzyme